MLINLRVEVNQGASSFLLNGQVFNNLVIPILPRPEK